MRGTHWHINNSSSGFEHETQVPQGPREEADWLMAMKIKKASELVASRMRSRYETGMGESPPRAAPILTEVWKRMRAQCSKSWYFGMTGA